MTWDSSGRESREGVGWMGRKAAVTPDWSQGLGEGKGPLGQSCTKAKDKGGSDLRLSSTFSHPRRRGRSQDIKSLC